MSRQEIVLHNNIFRVLTCEKINPLNLYRCIDSAVELCVVKGLTPSTRMRLSCGRSCGRNCGHRTEIVLADRAPLLGYNPQSHHGPHSHSGFTPPQLFRSQSGYQGVHGPVHPWCCLARALCNILSSVILKQCSPVV